MKSRSSNTFNSAHSLVGDTRITRKKLLSILIAVSFLISLMPFTGLGGWIFGDDADGIGSPQGIEPAAGITSGTGILATLANAQVDSVIDLGNESFVVVRVYGSGANRCLLLARRGGDLPGHFGPTNNYSGSDLQAFMTEYYMGDIGQLNPFLRGLILVPDLGNNSSLTATSEPRLPLTLASSTTQTVDIAFALSRQDMINWNLGKAYPVRSPMLTHWPRGGTTASHVWLRTKGTGNVWVWEFNNNGQGYIADAADCAGQTCTRAPAFWVRAAGVSQTVTVHYVDNAGVPVQPQYTTTYNVPYDESITLDSSDIPNFSGWQYTGNWRLDNPTGSNNSGSVSLSHVIADHDIYLVYDQSTPPGHVVIVHYVDGSDMSHIGDPTTRTYNVADNDTFTLPDTDIQDIRGYEYQFWQLGLGGSPNTSLPITVSNITTDIDIYLVYEEQPFEPYVEKNAYTGGISYPQNGSENDPILVDINEVIDFEVTVSNIKQDGAGSPAYDVIFVLDWQQNMMMGNMNGGNARWYAKQITPILAASVLNNYPGSRVAAVAVYASGPNYNNVANVSAYDQTGFMNSDSFNQSTFAAGFNHNEGNPTLYTDTSAYIQYAMDRLTELQPTNHIPVIVLISDYQATESNSNNNSGYPYWSETLKYKANDFEGAFPSGILYTVRLDHTLNYVYGSSVYDNHMNTYVITADRPNWDFSAIPSTTTVSNAATLIGNNLLSHMQVTGSNGTTLIDFLPEGLEVIGSSVSNNGIYNASAHTILWDLSSNAQEEVTVSFQAVVKAESMLFVNSAIAIFSDGTSKVSNSTYHISPGIILTEYFREFGNESHILDSSLDGNQLNIERGDPYAPAAGIPPETIVEGGITYSYYGYRIDNGDIDITQHFLLPMFLIDSVILTTDVTYLYVVQPQKNAYVNGNSVAENGTATDPVIIVPQSKIRYTIDFMHQREVGTSDVRYDVLFLLDWSDSMFNGRMYGSTVGSPGYRSARDYELDVMLDMFDEIMNNYDGSRVAVLAMNSTGMTGNPANSFIQYDTDFMNSFDYWGGGRADIVNAFTNTLPENHTEDLAQFLAAARYKMAGATSMSFGGSAGGAKIPKPRTFTNLPAGDNASTRTPVIVFISDFQVSASRWVDRFPFQVDRLLSSLPTLILQTVRFDHLGNLVGGNMEYSLEPHDKLMIDYLSPAGQSGWGFTKVLDGTSYQDALTKIKDDFQVLAPTGPNRGTIVADFVPVGLEVNISSITYDGVYNADTNMIVWNLANVNDGPVTLQFEVEVTFDINNFPATYINTAAVLDINGFQTQTNSTYHTTYDRVFVIDYFREFMHEDVVVDIVHDGNIHELLPGESYYHDDGIPLQYVQANGINYVYYGYRIDDSMIVDVTPHAQLPDLLIENVLKTTKVTFLYVEQPEKNAYINDALFLQPLNGSEDAYQRVKVGDTLVYEIIIDNRYIEYNDVTFTLMDRLPAGLLYVDHDINNMSAHTTDFFFDPVDRVCIWDWFGGLPMGETIVTITTTVEDADDAMEFINYATLYYSNIYAIETTRTYHEVKTRTTFDFTKVDEHDDPLTYVAFGLYECTNPSHQNLSDHSWMVTDDPDNCWGDNYAAVSSIGGYVHFDDLKPGTYMLVELGTVKGYQIPHGQWLVVIDTGFDITITARGPSDSDSISLPPAFKTGSEGELMLPNYPLMVMPLAGGPGLIVLTMLGLIYIGDGIIIAILTNARGRRLKPGFAGRKAIH
ncbi:MAG: prealbumin-like fold domain-containing protein [Coriobacteriia bacterium]|nr:prealbumin-like fold domain-containing protein [Coriobacteriia bacterium]